MRDLKNNLKVTSALIAANITTTTNGIVIDRQGFESAMMSVNVGNSGDTLSGTVFITLRLHHGDLANGTDMAAVPETDILGAIALTTTGDFAIINTPAGDSAVFKAGYRGTKRYIRVVALLTGTHTNGTPISATALLGRAASAPVA